MAQMKAFDMLMKDCLKAPVVFDAGLADKVLIVLESQKSRLRRRLPRRECCFLPNSFRLVSIMNTRGKVYHVEANIQT